MQTQVEELAQDRVRLTVEVPSAEVRHAVEHAASDLAGSVRIPGFRKGKVPKEILFVRLGRERVLTEAVESHIGGWFWNAAEQSRIHPVERPEYAYELPETEADSFQFTATVAVQPKPELADWKQLEVPAAEPEVPADLVDAELEALRAAAAEFVPAGDRPAQAGDTLIADFVDVESGEAQRDLVVELGEGRLIDGLERGLIGIRAGKSTAIEYELPDGSKRSVRATLKEIKEKVLPPLDDELARTTSEFETLAELRADIEERLREQLEAELEGQFRAAVVDRLVEASRVEASGPLVEARAADVWRGLRGSLERRGISVENYFQVTGQSAEDVREQLVAEARQSVARELVLEALADELGITVSDDEVTSVVREQAEAAGEDPDAVIADIWRDGRHEKLRSDLRLRNALDRVSAEVKRIPVELAKAREKLWTPGQEKGPGDTKLWTPGSKEPA